MDTITIRRPDDFHYHFRQGGLLTNFIHFVTPVFGRVLAMPNTKHHITGQPIWTADEAMAYREEIWRAAKAAPGGPNNEFRPLMTIQASEFASPERVREAIRADVVAVKFYPLGMTTNSEFGVHDYTKTYEVLEEMENVGMLALYHGESPDLEVDVLDRECRFLDILGDILRRFPGLKVVLEHITTKEAVEFVRAHPRNLAATITAHHLVITLNDVIGYGLEPDNFCKPVAKTAADRKALIAAATSGDSRYLFGSDSALHPKGAKYCAHGCAGCFTAPVAMPLLAEVFEKAGQLPRFEDFVSRFGAEWYGLPFP